jgi:hypothetical protein
MLACHSEASGAPPKNPGFLVLKTKIEPMDNTNPNCVDLSEQV